MVTFLISILFATQSFAFDYCVSVYKLHDAIKFCGDNPGYLPPAKLCRDQFMEFVAAKQIEIQTALANSSQASSKAQSKSLRNSKNTYQLANIGLTEMILRGKQVIEELDDYADDFVPPISPDEPDYFKPDRFDSKSRAMQPDLYCYSEPMKDLMKMIAELKNIVSGLEATRSQMQELEGSSGRKESDLGSLFAAKMQSNLKPKEGEKGIDRSDSQISGRPVGTNSVASKKGSGGDEKARKLASTSKVSPARAGSDQARKSGSSIAEETRLKGFFQNLLPTTTPKEEPSLKDEKSALKNGTIAEGTDSVDAKKEIGERPATLREGITAGDFEQGTLYGNEEQGSLNLFVRIHRRYQSIEKTQH